jgi:hypothetical protein
VSNDLAIEARYLRSMSCTPITLSRESASLSTNVDSLTANVHPNELESRLVVP